jgi:hypothetical protein
VFTEKSSGEITDDGTVVTLAPDELVASVKTIKTLDVVRNQVKARGENPLEYMEVSEIKAEIGKFVEKMTQGLGLTKEEEERLTYLTDCLTYNPEYMDEVRKENEQWLKDNNEYLQDCVQVMRGFVPVDIDTLSELELASRGMSTNLARRILTTRCLWLVRMTPDMIGKMHFADLIGAYSTEAKNLDVVELCAVLASLPDKFEADANGKKEGVKQVLLREVKSRLIQKQAGTLSNLKLRARQYNNQVPLFADSEEMMEQKAVVGDPFAERDSFKALGQHGSLVEDRKAALMSSKGIISSTKTILPKKI